MPNWLEQGYCEYAKRLSETFKLQLHEIPAQNRSKNADIKQTLKREAKSLLNAVPKGDVIIALDRCGKFLSTEVFSDQLKQWHDLSQNISILIGGPEGIDPHCLNTIAIKWSLSRFTLPHPLVRIIIAEQIYRAFSIISRHPYH